MTATGTVVETDKQTGSFVVRSASGASTTMFWNKETKVTGNLAVGANVDDTWMEKDG